MLANAFWLVKVTALIICFRIIMKYQGIDLNVVENETVLDALLRHKKEVSYSCLSGLCQSCLLHAIKGDIIPDAQSGLKSTAINSNHFLACQQPASTIDSVADIDLNALFSHAIVVEKSWYATDVLCLKLDPVNPHYYHAGQFINIRNPQGDIRSYSIANLPATEPFIELHIQRIVNGKLSTWLFDTVNLGDIIEFQGALGHCFYVPDSNNTDNDLMLIGTGTGAAPLIGIAKDALHAKHQGEIHFYHGVRAIESLYLQKQLTNLEEEYSNFYYYPCLSGEVNGEDNSLAFHYMNYGRASDIALQAISSPSTTQLFLCGNPDMVNTTKKMALLSGILPENIYTDPFEHL
jgi:NAD(P)H-flavin reductase/ferredoxin